MTSCTTAEEEPPTEAQQHLEPHDSAGAGRTNWLRAAVLGANDGIVSVAGLVVGVAGATQSQTTLVAAGLAGLVAGALSMGAGEYVSVSTQRDTERALLEKEREELAADPARELDELTLILEEKGVSSGLAGEVAAELMAHDAFVVHAEQELRLDPSQLVSPWRATVASVLSFTLGAILPFLAMVLPPPAYRLWVTVIAVLLALVFTGWLSARLGGASVRRGVLRVVVGGAAAMIITYSIGRLVAVIFGTG
jgi:vacuolar iron transporter family protein